jgi:hypothetical protein
MREPIGQHPLANRRGAGCDTRPATAPGKSVKICGRLPPRICVGERAGIRFTPELKDRAPVAGEAKRKRRAHAAILGRFPFCIYCGATAKTIEHMPPIQMFRLRDRPKGLEFPSCLECNNGTGDSDLVASLLGRTYPDAKLEHGRSELIKLLEAVGNNVPGLLQEMQVEAGGQKLARRSIPNIPPHTAVLRADGPILQHHMLTFGAKLGFALHFEFFGTRFRDDGGVQPFYYTNVSAARGELPLVA